MKKGIDVSQWNDKINWQSVKNDGIECAWIRSSYGASKSLSVIEDPLFRDHSNGALLAGLNVGPYHFSTLNSHEVVKDAALEADFFLKKIKAFPFNFNPVLDLESNNMELHYEEVFLWIKTFRDIIESSYAMKLVLYSYTPFLNSYLPNGIDMPLWLAQYPRDPNKTTSPTKPAGWKDKDLFAWQWSAEGKVLGIKTNVDMNKIY